MDQLNHDRRSLAIHRRVAEKLRADATQWAHARDILRRWQQQTPVGAGDWYYLNAWDRLLNGPEEECLRTVTADTDEARALRQQSPLSCLLSPTERWLFFKDWRRHNAP